MKILVIGPSWVGDMMMSQSLYRTLQARYPQAIIDVMAPAWCRPLLSRMPEVNEAIPMPLGHGALEIGERRKLGHSLREKRYDRAYVLPNSFKTRIRQASSCNNSALSSSSTRWGVMSIKLW